MEHLFPLVEVYEKSDTAYVRAGDLLVEMKDYKMYLSIYENKGIIKVQWTQHPKIKLTPLGYETLKDLC